MNAFFTKFLSIFYLNEYFRFYFELNIELNRFWAWFNIWMNNANVSNIPTKGAKDKVKEA